VELDHQRTAAAQPLATRRDEAPVGLETIAGGEDRVGRLVEQIRPKPGPGDGQVRQVGDDQIERAPDRLEEVTAADGDAAGEA
jgi:hypothetical protein